MISIPTSTSPGHASPQWLFIGALFIDPNLRSRFDFSPEMFDGNPRWVAWAILQLESRGQAWWSVLAIMNTVFPSLMDDTVHVVKGLEASFMVADITQVDRYFSQVVEEYQSKQAGSGDRN